MSIDQSLRGGVLGENQDGFYEIKWLDQYESGRPIKRKLRIQGKYAPDITFDSVRQMALLAQQDNKLGAEVLESLDKHLIEISKEGFHSMNPLFVAEYKRSRYLHNVDGGKKNIVSVDRDVQFHQINPKGNFTDLGRIDGCIVEYKESVDDTKLRWQIYRTLVDCNATRFYG